MNNLNISAWAIRHPVPSLVLFLVLMVLGTLSFQALPVTKFPNIDVPIIQVHVYQSGAAPSELETQVTKKVEDAISGIVGVKHITSTVTEGVSMAVVEFELETDADRALNDVKDAISRIRTDLPRTIEEPVIQRLQIEGLPILQYSASAPQMTLEELSWFVDDVVKRELQSAKGVSSVARVGGVDREIRVALDPDRLLAMGVTAGDVNRQVRATNVDLAGGRGEIGGREQAIRTLAGKQTVEELAATTIALSGGRKVRLDSLATVEDSIEEPSTFATLNGEPIVAFSISRATGASETEVEKSVEKHLATLRMKYPDVQLSQIDTTVNYTLGAYQSTMTTLIEGALLAILVVFIFLRDVRATIIAAIALPLSIIPAFWAIDAMGFSLNLVSLLAITIVTGILVDDAIVEIENIVRHMRMGKSAYRASLEAADEIGLAVIAITVTIIAVFVPVSFMGGIAGQYFKQFGLTVAAAVLFSLLVARLITPLLAAYFMRETDRVEKEGWLLKTYTRLVGWSVDHRIKTVVLGLLVFAGSIASFYVIPSSFLPQEDTGRSLLAVELPPGSRLDDTRHVTDDIQQRIRKIKGVKSVYVSGGMLLGGGAERRKATLIITLTPKEERTVSQDTLRGVISENLRVVPDVRFWFVEEDGQRQFQLVVSGRDSKAVDEIGAALASQAKRLPELANVVSTAELDRPELRVYPKTDVAADLGVTTEAISEAVRIATIGDIDANLAKFDVGDRQVPIRVQLKEAAREKRDLIENIRVTTADDSTVPLVTVARFELDQGPTSIDRYDRTRRVILGADLIGNTPLGDAMARVLALPAVQNLPPGIEVKEFGAAEIMGEVFESFAAAMGAGLMMVYAVLVLLFSSFLLPITILFSLPLSIGGAIIALAITQNPVSLPVVIGILMLMGIVTKNAIMLVDFAVEEIAKGVPHREAIVDAGRKRARPIVMTTIAMVGGMLPSAMAVGSGGEFRAPMAIAVIGGLISSTMLSLVFVPAVFALLDDVAQGLWSFFSRFIGPTDEVDAENDQTSKSETSLVSAKSTPLAAE